MQEKGLLIKGYLGDLRMLFYYLKKFLEKNAKISKHTDWKKLLKQELFEKKARFLTLFIVF